MAKDQIEITLRVDRAKYSAKERARRVEILGNRAMAAIDQAISEENDSGMITDVRSVLKKGR